MVEDFGIQIDNIRIRTLMIGVAFLAASLELAMIALPIRKSFLHGFMTVQAERIVHPPRQGMARVAILQFLLLRVRPREISGREEPGEG